MKRSSIARTILGAAVAMFMICAAVAAPVPQTPALAGAHIAPTAQTDVSLAATVVTIDGTRVWGFETGTMNQKLNGIFIEGNEVVPLKYPALLTFSSTPKGIKALTPVMLNVEDDMVFVGYSQGANVIILTIEKLAKNPNWKPSGKERIIMMGVPNSKVMQSGTVIDLAGITTVIVAKEYDGFADMPSKFSLKALSNAFAGMVSQAGHVDYNQLNFDDPRNRIMVEGSVTKVLLYAEHLPKNAWLRKWGLNELADKLDARDRGEIEKAYNRKGYEFAAPGQIREILWNVSHPGNAGAQTMNEVPQSESAARRSTLKLVADPQVDESNEKESIVSEPAKRSRNESLEKSTDSEVIEQLEKAEVDEIKDEEIEAGDRIETPSEKSEASEEGSPRHAREELPKSMTNGNDKDSSTSAQRSSERRSGKHRAAA